jgi:hypothetical protein
VARLAEKAKKSCPKLSQMTNSRSLDLLFVIDSVDGQGRNLTAVAWIFSALGCGYLYQ